MGFGKLALRVVVGGFFIGHGTQKLFGWFGGGGLEGTDRMMQAIDMRPVRRNSIGAGVAETVGGSLLVLGLATPLAAAGLIGTMLTAVRKVHWKNGPWSSQGGWEYNAVMIAAVTSLVDAGPGKVSLDAAMGRVKSGPGWALGALAAGVAGSTALVEFGRRETDRQKSAEAARERARSVDSSGIIEDETEPDGE